MNIAILGNGRMGKRISELAIERGHEIVATSSSNTPATSLDLTKAEVAIDFSTPDTAFENIKHSITNNLPVVSGTTGWLAKIKEIETYCTKQEGAFLYASNFSIGMNIFFQLNKQLAELMKAQKYTANLHEIHHTQKLDSPSGTAKTLGEDMDSILQSNTPITADRIEDVPGTHIITYNSSQDEIEIKHTAKNRDGFAMGAIIAAEWIVGKKGIFSMNDVLRIQ